MNILIAGSAWFMVSNLCDYLFDNGHNIIAIDNFSQERNRIYFVLEMWNELYGKIVWYWLQVLTKEKLKNNVYN